MESTSRDKLMRIYLTGFMASGKTTVGRLLAEKLKWEFYDLDKEIEQATGKSIAEVFHISAEPGFREIEAAKLKSLLPKKAVIATGGGCFIENREWMLQNGTVIYLQVPFDQLVRRVGADPSRPLWKNAAALFQQREGSYSSAHVTIDGTPSPDDVATEMMKKLKLI